MKNEVRIEQWGERITVILFREISQRPPSCKSKKGPHGARALRQKKHHEQLPWLRRPPMHIAGTGWLQFIPMRLRNRKSRERRRSPQPHLPPGGPPLLPALKLGPNETGRMGAHMAKA